MILYYHMNVFDSPRRFSSRRENFMTIYGMLPLIVRSVFYASVLHAVYAERIDLSTVDKSRSNTIHRFTSSLWATRIDGMKTLFRV